MTKEADGPGSRWPRAWIRLVVRVLADVSDLVEIGLVAVVGVSVVGLAYGDMLKIPVVRGVLLALVVSIPVVIAFRRASR